MTGRRLLLAALGVALLGVAVRLPNLGHPSQHHKTQPSTSSSITSHPTVTASASDVLNAGLSFAANASSGVVVYLADVVSGSSQPLAVNNPVQLLAPDGTQMAVDFAGIFPYATARKYLRSPASGRPSPLRRIAPAQAVALLIRVHVDCHLAAAIERWQPDMPEILVYLNRSPTPAKFHFDRDTGGYAGLVRDACQR
jgi:hypothetical protein